MTAGTLQSQSGGNRGVGGLRGGGEGDWEKKKQKGRTLSILLSFLVGRGREISKKAALTCVDVLYDCQSDPPRNHRGDLQRYLFVFVY